MNYYPFHLGDYAAHTAHLEPLEDLAYRRMLDAYYLRESPLPADPADVARIIRMRQNMVEVEVVLREFFHLSAEGWRHVRCDEEIEHMQDKQAKARASAAASVNARRAKADRPLNAGTAPSDRTLNERSADVELPTPTPIPTPTPCISEPIGSESARKPRATRKCPSDFAVTPEMREWAVANAVLANIDAATEAFRDHTFKNAISDWNGAWRNWLRRDHQYAHERQKGPARRAPAPENFDAINYGEGISPL